MADRILFFDDDPARHRGFTMMTIGQIVDHVYNAQECIRALRDKERYNIVYLDHDMDMNHSNQHETGLMVADYIYLHLNRDKYPDKVIIHSWNTYAAQTMEKVIAEAGIPVVRKPYKNPIRY